MIQLAFLVIPAVVGAAITYIFGQIVVAVIAMIAAIALVIFFIASAREHSIAAFIPMTAAIICASFLIGMGITALCLYGLPFHPDMSWVLRK